MKEKIKSYLNEVESFSAKTIEDLESFRIKFLSKKGLLPSLFADFKNVAPEERKELGQQINLLKQAVQQKIVALKESFDKQSESGSASIDGVPPLRWRPAPTSLH